MPLLAGSDIFPRLPPQEHNGQEKVALGHYRDSKPSKAIRDHSPRKIDPLCCGTTTRHAHVPTGRADDGVAADWILGCHALHSLLLREVVQDWSASQQENGRCHDGRADELRGLRQGGPLDPTGHEVAVRGLRLIVANQAGAPWSSWYLV